MILILQTSLLNLIKYLYKEASEYAKLGGTNEAWGLVHAAKQLEKIFKQPVLQSASIRDPPKRQPPHW